MKEVFQKVSHSHGAVALVALFFIASLGVAQGRSSEDEATRDNNSFIVAVAGNVPLKVLAEQGEVLQEDIATMDDVASMRLRSGVVQNTYINALVPDQEEEIFQQLAQKNVFNANDAVNIAGTVFLLSNTTREQLISRVLDAKVQLDGQEIEVSDVTSLVKEVGFGNQIHWVGFWNTESNEFLREKALYYEVILREDANSNKVGEKLVQRLSHASFSAEGVSAKLVEKTERDVWYTPILKLLRIQNSVDTQRIAVYVPNDPGSDEQTLIGRSAAIDQTLKRYISDIDSYYYRYNGYAHGNIQPFEIVINLVPEQQMQTSEDVAAGIQAELTHLFGDEATAKVIE